jgi:hypothetical protein
MLAIEDDVEMALEVISSARKYHGDLTGGGVRKIIPTAIRVPFKVESDPTLLVRWQIPCLLKGLVIEGNPRVVVVDHVLEVAKGVEAEVGVVRVIETILEGVGRIVYVELTVDGSLAWERMEGASLVG